MNRSHLTQVLARSFTLALLLAICLFPAAVSARPEPRALSDVTLPSHWWDTGAMNSVRVDFTLSLLFDGKALAAGGFYNDGVDHYLNSSETYDLTTGVWSLAGNMSAARMRHTATILLDGRILASGGKNGSGPLSSAETFNPLTRTWTPTGSMAQTREGHTATRLNDGRVLVVGGCQTLACLTSAEIYDPVAGTWQSAASLPAGPRKYHTAVLLSDGSVLVAGGYSPFGANPTYYKTAYRYNPASNTWSAAGSMFEYRSQHTAVLQRNGKVMVVGGYGVPPFGSGVWPDFTEAYDPATNTWSKLKNTSNQDILIDYGKKQALGVLDAFGSYYLIGGTDGTASGSVLYRSTNNDTDTWHAHGMLQRARAGAAAVQLHNGAILLAGGQSEVYGPMSHAEINTADSGSAEINPSVAISGTVYSTGTLMPNGDILFTGGADVVHQSNGLPCHKTAHLWLLEEAVDSLPAQMKQERCSHSTTLLPDGRVVVIGGVTVTHGGPPAGAAEILAGGAWTAISGPSFPGPKTALLPDGQILIVDPSTRPHAYLFDPQTLSFRQTAGDYTGTYNGHTLTLMNNGKVLLLGSASSDVIEVYDPQTETFTVVPALPDRRLTHTATLLPNGKVLIAGGRYGSGPNQGRPMDSTYLFNPGVLPANPWTSLDTLHNARYLHSAVLLPDGRVAVLGGQIGSNDTIKSVELYDPARNFWAVVGDLLVDRSAHKTILSPNGKLVTFGGYGDGFTARTTVEQFELTNVATWGFFWRPTLSGATCLNCAGTRQIELGGSGFTGPSEGSSGGTAQAAANTPLVLLMRLDNEQSLWLNPGQPSSDTLFRSAPIPAFPNGPAMAFVFTRGSLQGVIVLIHDQETKLYIPLVKR